MDTRDQDGILNANYTHGMTSTAEYSIWASMKYRCNNPGCDAYESYGGRGITYDPAWEKFENFYSDMGQRPSYEYTLERENNELGYSKTNCVWATRLQQQRNRRNSIKFDYKGGAYTIDELAELSGIDRSTLNNRLCRDNWSVHDVVNTPIKVRKHGESTGVNDTMILLASEVTHKDKTQQEIANFLGVSRASVSRSLWRTKVRLHKEGLDK